ncbi:Glutathione transport system permease protein GsiC [Shimia thalassica]|uniref:Glutathione transport system permease protein GsiC n=1 Tax=Shimia thalassica TaxID=1715693 RepID=A0A0P1I3C2_9RHOB|nr:Glutathione transport system permease protein GsiC [Shimia thalassica]
MNSILSIILKRLMIGLLTLWVVTIIIFAAIELLPGDIATEILGQAATEESLAAFREKYDLNRPVYERYISWLSGAMTGDFGVSLANQRPISVLI